MRKYIFCLIVIISVFLFSFRLFNSESISCSVDNHMFTSGEELRYEVMYNWGFIWLNAGEVVFKLQLEDYKGKPCYHISGIGGTYPSYDWIYKVRDRFECWVDTSTLQPFRYIRDVKEGGRTFYNECFFNHARSKAYCVTIDQKKSPRLDTVTISPCAFDPLTMIFFSRTIDYSKYKQNDTIPIALFLDNEIFPLYIRYFGSEKHKADNNVVFNCIKFKPKLVEGTLFKGGEEMIVWASNDKNRIPIYVEAPILVGSVKAKIVSWKGLRNKMESKVE
ncbi:MAG TPA: DUF3108 domain-containing protein [Bacteroidia bacterium]|nr:DUF3108 domain-containing protein [Bacteroidia bacterium]